MLLHVILAVITWLIGVVVYRLVFHPLARYPGPLLAKLTDWYSVYHAFIGDVQLDMSKCHEQYGKFVRYGPNKLIVNSPNAKHDIYSRGANVQKSKSYRAFRASPTALDLQSTIDNAAHARKRRIITQAFSDSVLKALEEHVLVHVNAFIECLSDNMSESCSKVSGQLPWSTPKNLAHWCSYLSLDLMSEHVFGKPVGVLRNNTDRYIFELIRYTTFRAGVCLQMPWLASWNVNKIISPNAQKLRDQYLAISKIKANERMMMESRQDLLSHILAARDPETGGTFTMDEIWGEAQLVIIAGSDAMSTAMAACFFYLSRNRIPYEKACTEIRSVFSTLEEIRTGAKLASCTYLRACIEEALRMSPPVGAAVWREVCEGGLYIDGQKIAEGTDVGVGIYALHHNVDYFPSPFEFSPERWIVSKTNTEEKIASARSALAAFIMGPAGCPGKNLAIMETTLTLAHVLWSLDMCQSDAETDQNIEPRYVASYPGYEKYEYRLRDRFTSWKDGPMLKFRPRNI